jgi:hypothetical protein
MANGLRVLPVAWVQNSTRFPARRSRARAEIPAECLQVVETSPEGNRGNWRSVTIALARVDETDSPFPASLCVTRRKLGGRCADANSFGTRPPVRVGLFTARHCCHVSRPRRNMWLTATGSAESDPTRPDSPDQRSSWNTRVPSHHTRVPLGSPDVPFVANIWPPLPGC